jgi:O-antigen/teichoic acid export membrane protein
LALFAPQIVQVVAPASYAPASRIVPLIAFGYALNGLYLMMVTGMGVTKKSLPMAWVVAIAAAANVGINILVIPRWGMMAAAVTTVLANLIMVAGCWYYSHKVYPIPYDWSRIARTAALGIAVVLLTRYLAPTSGVAATAVNLAAWLGFVVLLVWTRALPVGELAQAWGAITRFRRGWLREPPEERLAG